MSTDAEIHQTLGGLKATVEHLNDTVKGMVTMWTNQEKDAAAGRRILYEKVEALKDSVAALGTRVGSVETKLTEIKPAVQEFENQREQQKGAMKLGKLLWTAMLAACGGTGATIGWFIGHLGQSGAPPPGH